MNSEGIAQVVKNYMRISQKQSYKKDSISKQSNTNLPIMEKIKTFLDVKNVTFTKRNKNSFVELTYEVRTTKKDSCAILINYLSKYPLFSSKHQDYIDWEEFHRIRLSKQYKTNYGTSKLISLKNSMNTKRTQFN